MNEVGIFINSLSLSVQVADGSTTWTPGSIVQFIVDDTSNTLSFPGSQSENEVKITITVVSTSTGYSGASTVSEEVRLVTE